MFYPQPMTEVELIVPANDILPVTQAIRGQGVFHQIDGSSLSAASDTGSADREIRSVNPWQEKATAYMSVERRIQALLQIFEMEEGLPPETELETMVEIESARSTVEQI